MDEPILWGLRSYFVDDVLGVYPSREQAEETMRRVIAEEPVWKGTLTVVQLRFGSFCPN
jgi:hypothetical protein